MFVFYFWSSLIPLIVLFIALAILIVEYSKSGQTYKKPSTEPTVYQTIELNYFIPNEEETREQMLRFTCGYTDKKLSSLEKAKDVERLWREAINRTPYCVEGYESEFVNHRDALDDYFAFGTTTRYPENTPRGFFLKRIEEAAYEQGIDSMLDAYFAGVPVDDIIA